MRGTSPVLAGVVLLAGAAGLLGLSDRAAIRSGAVSLERALLAGQTGGYMTWAGPSSAPSPSASPTPLPSPSSAPAPVPVVTEEEVWLSPSPSPLPSPEPTPTPDPEPAPAPTALDTAAFWEIQNNTDYAVDLPSLPALPEGMELQSQEPVILIVHTHTTECYASDQREGYRSTDPADGVMAVGDRIQETLEARGYPTVHDKTLCDYPEYNGAYDRSREVIRAALERYPSVCLVLDVHRDAAEQPDGSQVRMAADIQGQPTAKLMLVVGTDAGGLEHPLWRQNLSLAALIQSGVGSRYPGIMRPIDLRTQRFNQDLGPMGLLVEVGASGNTLEEALRGGACFAQGLADVLDGYCGKSP